MIMHTQALYPQTADPFSLNELPITENFYIMFTQPFIINTPTTLGIKCFTIDLINSASSENHPALLFLPFCCAASPLHLLGSSLASAHGSRRVPRHSRGAGLTSFKPSAGKGP